MSAHRPNGPLLPRATTRESIFLTAMLNFDVLADPVSVRIRNISSGGMLVDCDLAVGPGDRFTGEVKNVGKISGRVAWRTDNRMGVEFDGQVDPKRARAKTTGDARDPAYTNRAIATRCANGLRY